MFQADLNAWIVETTPRESSVLRDTHHTIFFLVFFFFSINPIKRNPLSSCSDKGQQSKKRVEIPILNLLSQQKSVTEGTPKYLTWPQ